MVGSTRRAILHFSAELKPFTPDALQVAERFASSSHQEEGAYKSRVTFSCQLSTSFTRHLQCRVTLDSMPKVLAAATSTISTCGYRLTWTKVSYSSNRNSSMDARLLAVAVAGGMREQLKAVGRRTVGLRPAGNRKQLGHHGKCRNRFDTCCLS